MHTYTNSITIKYAVLKSIMSQHISRGLISHCHLVEWEFKQFRIYCLYTYNHANFGRTDPAGLQFMYDLPSIFGLSGTQLPIKISCPYHLQQVAITWLKNYRVSHYYNHVIEGRSQNLKLRPFNPKIKNIKHKLKARYCEPKSRNLI